MRPLATVIVTLAIAALLHACGNKADSAGTGAAGSSTATASPGPATCPPGSVVKDGACTVVVTPETIAAVTQQQSRLDALATFLDQVDTVGAPIELFNGIRQLEPWQTLKARSARIAALDTVAGTLNNAVKTLRTFKANLGEASARLSNLDELLHEQMTDNGEARKLEDVRASISAQLRAVVEPLGAQIQDTIQNALVPLTTQLSELSDVVVTGCTMAKLSSGGDKMKDLCAQSKDAFVKALAYVGDLKSKPAQLFTDVTSQLETQLGLLVDAETRKVIDAAQRKVAEALQLPPTGSASGSAGSGAASAGSGAAAAGSGTGGAGSGVAR